MPPQETIAPSLRRSAKVLYGTRQRPTVGPVRRWSAVVGVVAQVLVTVFLYLPAGLLVPAAAWVVLTWPASASR